MPRMRVRMELSMYGIPGAWGEIVYVRECLGEELLIHCKHKIKTTNYYGGERKLQPALEGKPILNHTPNSMLSSQCRALETTQFLPFFSLDASAEFCLALKTKPNAVLKEQS